MIISAEMGCLVADHGLENMIAEECTYKELQLIFSKIRAGKELNNGSN